MIKKINTDEKEISDIHQEIKKHKRRTCAKLQKIREALEHEIEFKDIGIDDVNVL
jgi:hypothetical protein